MCVDGGGGRGVGGEGCCWRGARWCRRTGGQGGALCVQVLETGMHAMVQRVVNKGAKALLVGSPAAVRAGVDFLVAGEQDATPLYKVVVDLWVPAAGGVEARQCKYIRRHIAFVATSPMGWQVCVRFLPRWSAWWEG